MHGAEKVVYVESGADFTLKCSVHLTEFGVYDDMNLDSYREYLNAKEAIEQGIGSAIYRDSVIKIL